MSNEPKNSSAAVITLPAGEPVPVGKGSHVYLIDGSGYIFRAFHALPPLTRPSDGLPVGAVHGFCAMLWKLMADAKAGRGPTHIAVIFDASRENYRNEIYKDYKANRPPAPEELIPQFPLIRDAVKAFNVACIEQEGYEADDLIATYAKDAIAAGGDVTIVSSDKDLMQLVKPGVTMLDTMKNKTINREEVIEKFGVEPDKVVDVQSLAGDSVDNVPGVPGIGIKTAAELIKEYGDLDTLLARADEIKQPKRRERLIEFADQARISRELVRLKEDVPIEVQVDRLGVQDVDPEPLLAFMRDMEFNTLTKRVAEAMGVAVPPPLERSVGASLKSGDDGSKSKSSGSSASESAAKAAAGETTPAEVVAFARSAAREPKIDLAAYETVRTKDRLDAWIAEAREIGRVSFDTETTSLDAMQADLVGFSLAIAPGRACYVPVGHKEAGGDLFGGGGLLADQIPLRDAIEALKPLLEDPATLKIGQNLKYDALVLKRHGIRLAPIDDTMLMSYALDGGRGSHGMDALAERHLGHVCISFDQVIAHAPGAKKSEKTFAGVPIDKATAYAAEDADVTLRLWMALKPASSPSA
ncbi:MAG: 5'-3' exonuclease H3TH domain-containing protein [Hyphomicrobiaceae bacterium]